MPTTIASAIVIALAIIPGAFGSYVWDLVNGHDWRAKEWESALRFLAFSILGLAIYVLCAAAMGLPPAIHVLPATYAAPNLTSDALLRITLPYMGHIVGSSLVGGIAAIAHRGVCKLRGWTPQPSAWDHFIKAAAPGRWAVVTLSTGDVFAGYLHTAEESAPAGERDVVLGDPARWDPQTGNYIVSSLRFAFFPAAIVQTIGAVRLDSELADEPTIGSPLFPNASKESSDG